MAVLVTFMVSRAAWQQDSLFIVDHSVIRYKVQYSSIFFNKQINKMLIKGKTLCKDIWT